MEGACSKKLSEKAILYEREEDKGREVLVLSLVFCSLYSKRGRGMEVGGKLLPTCHVHPVNVCFSEYLGPSDI